MGGTLGEWHGGKWAESVAESLSGRVDGREGGSWVNPSLPARPGPAAALRPARKTSASKTTTPQPSVR